MRRHQLLLATILATAPLAGHAADKIKVGMITTFTGSEATYGQMETDGFNLGVKHLGNKLGGLPVEIVTGDDENKTDVAIQLATKMVERDKVDVITGAALTTTVLGVDKITREAKVPFISGGPGPSVLAGKGCNPYFFSVGWQNDALAEATGQYLTDHKVENVYLLAPQIQAGRDMLSGVKRHFTGTVIAEKYARMTQMDFAAEISEIEAVKPKALFIFFPAGQEANFIQQWNQAGMKDKVPVYTMNAIDQANLPGLGDTALGIPIGANWTETIDAPINKRFVDDFVASTGKLPSSHAAAAYNAALILDAAVAALGGKIEDKEALRHAIKTAKFTQVTGKPFKFGTNNMPVEDYYVGIVAKNAKGQAVIANPVVVLPDYVDVYAKDCKMTGG